MPWCLLQVYKRRLRFKPWYSGLDSRLQTLRPKFDSQSCHSENTETYTDTNEETYTFMNIC